MESLAKREIGIKDYRIDRNGTVWLGAHQRVPTTSFRSRMGLTYSGFTIDGKMYSIWRTLSTTWYDCSILLTRSGSLMSWKGEEVIQLKAVSSGAITEVEEIHKVWQAYSQGLACWQISEHTGLTHPREAYLSLVKDILIAGIRG